MTFDKAEYMREWRARNPGRMKAYRAAYYEANREARNAAVIAWRKAHPEKSNELKRAWRKRKRLT